MEDRVFSFATNETLGLITSKMITISTFVFVRRGCVLVVESLLRGTDNDVNYKMGCEIKYCELI
jgi:hypothetical protein